MADQDGIAKINRNVPDSARGIEILLQGVQRDACAVTRVLRTVFD